VNALAISGNQNSTPAAMVAFGIPLATPSIPQTGFVNLIALLLGAEDAAAASSVKTLVKPERVVAALRSARPPQSSAEPASAASVDSPNKHEATAIPDAPAPTQPSDAPPDAVPAACQPAAVVQPDRIAAALIRSMLLPAPAALMLRGALPATLASVKPSEERKPSDSEKKVEPGEKQEESNLQVAEPAPVREPAIPVEVRATTKLPALPALPLAIPQVTHDLPSSSAASETEPHLPRREATEVPPPNAEASPSPVAGKGGGGNDFAFALRLSPVASAAVSEPHPQASAQMPAIAAALFNEKVASTSNRIETTDPAPPILHPVPTSRAQASAETGDVPRPVLDVQRTAQPAAERPVQEVASREIGRTEKTETPQPGTGGQPAHNAPEEGKIKSAVRVSDGDRPRIMMPPQVSTFQADFAGAARGPVAPPPPQHAQTDPSPSVADAPQPHLATVLRESEAPQPAAPIEKPPLAQEIAVRIARPEAPPVDVQLTERAGQVHVAVRTPDPALQASLRQDLNTLVNSLERTGFRAETLVPGDRTSQQPMRSIPASHQPEFGSGGYGWREGRNPHQNPSQQNRRQQSRRESKYKAIEPLENAA
jgi:hypothetical protein